MMQHICHCLADRMRVAVQKRFEELARWLDENNVGSEKVYDFHPDHFAL